MLPARLSLTTLLCYVLSLLCAARALAQPANCPQVLSLGAAGGTRITSNTPSSFNPGAVWASTWWDSDGAGPEPEWLVVAGSFTHMDGVPASNVAAWDGLRWRALGTGPWQANATTLTQSTAHGLAVIDGQLYVTGRFAIATGSTNYVGVCRLENSTWVPVGDGLTLNQSGSYRVNSLVQHEGVIYAGGSFQVGSFTNGFHCARLVNGAWQPAGDGLGNSSAQGVSQLLIHNDELYACGNFWSTFTVFPRGIAKLSGFSWVPVGTSPMTSAQLQINAMQSDGSDLLIAGFYSLAGSSSTYPRISRFDGRTYTDVSLPSSTATGADALLSLARLNGALHTTALNGLNVLRLNDQSLLDAAGEAINESILGNDRRRIVIIGESDGTRANLPAGLIIGGQFDRTETLTPFGLNNWRPVYSLTIFDGSLHYPITRSPDRLVNDLITYQNDMIAVGTFLSAGGQKMNRIGAFDGTRWRPLDDGTGLNDRVLTAGLWNNKLVVGGLFTQAGNVQAQRIAAWNGTNWEAIGRIPEGAVRNVLDWNGTLLAVCANNITRVSDGYAPVLRQWNGTTWELFGGSQATSAAFLPTLVDGTLYANLHGTNQPSRWTGSQWERMPGGVSGETVLIGGQKQGRLLGSSATARQYVFENNAWRTIATSIPSAPGRAFDSAFVRGLTINVGVTTANTQPAAWIFNGGQVIPLASQFLTIPNVNSQTFTCVHEYQGRIFLGGSLGSIFQSFFPPTLTPAFTMMEVVLPSPPTTTPSFEASSSAFIDTLAGQDVLLRAAVANGEGLQRSWLIGNTQLIDGLQPDGSTISGATTDELRIENVPSSLSLTTIRLQLSGPQVCGAFGRGTNFQIRVTPACDSIDFNNDSMMPADEDLIAFLTVLSGGDCPTQSCNDIDFNNDGLFPSDTDLLSFLSVLAGGPCL